MIWLFLISWALLFAASVFLIAATPTTVATPNKALLWPLGLTGVAAGLVTLAVAGVFSLIGVA
jgi:hypothetical protein